MTTFAPPQACCAVHADETARTVCQRCGSFMCLDCSNRGTELRCAKCRPRYGPAELEERRLHAVTRAAFVRCAVCDLESPRFDRAVPLSRSALVPVLLGSTAAGLLGIFFLVSAVRRTQPACVGCERADGLEPLLDRVAPMPAGWNEMRAANRRVVLRNVLWAIPGALLLGALFAAFVDLTLQKLD